MDVYHQFGVFRDGEYPDCIPEEEEDNGVFQGMLGEQSALRAPKWASTTGVTPAMPEGFGFGGPILKPNRRKSDPQADRIVRSGAGRRDRHSKVCTARGTRDRRVRLSPRTAIQFYDVQDRLGYDRPSKAIDWLMKEAKAAIDALYAPPLPGSFAGDGDYSKKTPEHLSDDITGSGFSFFNFNNEAQFLPSPSVDCPDNIFPIIPSEAYNLEMSKLHRIFHFPVTSAAGRLYSQREPLQSSVISPVPNLQTHAGEDEFPVSGEPPPAASCLLHYHQL